MCGFVRVELRSPVRAVLGMNRPRALAPYVLPAPALDNCRQVKDLGRQGGQGCFEQNQDPVGRAPRRGSSEAGPDGKTEIQEALEALGEALGGRMAVSKRARQQQRISKAKDRLVGELEMAVELAGKDLRRAKTP